MPSQGLLRMIYEQVLWESSKERCPSIPPNIRAIRKSQLLITAPVPLCGSQLYPVSFPPSKYDTLHNHTSEAYFNVSVNLPCVEKGLAALEQKEVL